MTLSFFGCGIASCCSPSRFIANNQIEYLHPTHPTFKELRNRARVFAVGRNVITKFGRGVITGFREEDSIFTVALQSWELADGAHPTIYCQPSEFLMPPVKAKQAPTTDPALMLCYVSAELAQARREIAFLKAASYLKRGNSARALMDRADDKNYDRDVTLSPSSKWATVASVTRFAFGRETAARAASPMPPAPVSSFDSEANASRTTTPRSSLPPIVREQRGAANLKIFPPKSPANFIPLSSAGSAGSASRTAGFLPPLSHTSRNAFSNSEVEINVSPKSKSLFDSMLARRVTVPVHADLQAEYLV